MNNKEIQSLRSRITVQINELNEVIAGIKTDPKTSAETCTTPNVDIIDCAKDERDLKDQIRIHNHRIASLGELTGALHRINGGTFGQCQECGDPIGVSRLHARPGATLCIGCQEFFEGSHVAA